MISYTSISSLFNPAFFKASGIAKAGPIPIISGGTPATAYDLYLAKIGNPSLTATDLLANNTPAAPSVTYELLPAVVEPPFLKAGLNLLNYCLLVYLIPSSSLTITYFSLPSLSLTIT